MRMSLTLIALAALAAPAGAQQPPPSADNSWIADILNLPQTVEEGRRAGIPTGTIRVVLDSLRRRRVPAGDAEQILRGEVEAVKGGAPKENFGAFVNAQLARGLSGRELADAIHAEHARRGIGQGRRPHAPDAAGHREPPDTVKGKGRGRNQ